MDTFVTIPNCKKCGNPELITTKTGNIINEVDVRCHCYRDHTITRCWHFEKVTGILIILNEKIYLGVAKSGIAQVLGT